MKLWDEFLIVYRNMMNDFGKIQQNIKNNKETPYEKTIDLIGQQLLYTENVVHHLIITLSYIIKEIEKNG